MAEECTWDPSKHNGQACPKHGNGGKSGGYSTSIKGGQWKLKRDNADEEDISEKEYNELRGNEKFDDNDEEELEYSDKKYNHWTEVYENEFGPIVDKLLLTESGPAKITKEVDKLYAKHKGEPAWDEAYKRWMSTSEDNEDEEEEYDTWNDVYEKEFGRIVDKHPITKSGMAKINKEIDELYAKHKGEPVWDEAYKRWMDSDIDS